MSNFGSKVVDGNLKEYIVKRGGKLLGSVRSAEPISYAVITLTQGDLPRIEVASWHCSFEDATEALLLLKRENPELGVNIAPALPVDGPAVP